jgi:hypothetical protein
MKGSLSRSANIRPSSSLPKGVLIPIDAEGKSPALRVALSKIFSRSSSLILSTYGAGLETFNFPKSSLGTNPLEPPPFPSYYYKG